MKFDYKCPECKKDFRLLAPGQHLYQINNKHYCSYTCWNKAKLSKLTKGDK